jgi:Ca2+-transporting ATPase
MDINFAAHAVNTDEIFSKLESAEDGLTEKQVSERLEKYGSNSIREKKQKSLFRLFLDQVNNPVIYLLLGAVIISFIFGDIPEAIAIIVVIILNTAIGFWMEYQARTSVDALKKLNRLKTKVVRGNKTTETDATEIVPGDIIKLEAGDVVPADARIISFSELNVDESPLTGESLPVEKNSDTIDKETELAERNNMLYKGTAITRGKVTAVITATGAATEIGKISAMTQEESKDDIPINKKLGKLSHNLIWATVGLASVFFVVGWLAGKEVYLMLQTSIAWTVAAIPEGLPIVASIALARGMLRLARKNVIVKRLAAVETLGETTVIFTDKTGTLTENRLTLETIEFPGQKTEAKKLLEKGDKNKKSDEFSGENESLQHILNVALFCNDASEKEKGKVTGDPLDVSLFEYFKKYAPSQSEKLLETERINEDPFDSDDKFMGTIHLKDDQLYISGKGAVEAILSRCDTYFEDGEKKGINDDFKKNWLKRNEELSGKGLKVIAFAYKTAKQNERDSLENEEDFVHKMIFLGIVSFIDPAKENVNHAIEKCKNAGIKIIMVTGDHPGTAKNIAEKVEISDADEIKVLKGAEIKDSNKDIYSANLFARVDPKQKYDIVERFKKEGEITAMTGDGVNDAPALKKADIGIAMGKRGTQIAQDVADMILKDDSFSSIVDAIEQGRIIFGNIRKFIMYQLSYHLAEILIIAGISFSLFYLPLLPLQLLFLNLLSDVFPALALGLGKGDETIMQQKPKNPDEPIINKRNWITMGIYGVIIAVFTTSAYLLILYQFNESKEIANTVAFFSLALSQLIHVFNMREPAEKLFNNQILKNKYIWMALGFCIAVLISSYFIPVFKNVLSFESLKTVYWFLIFGTSAITLIVIQTVKSIFRL